MIGFLWSLHLHKYFFDKVRNKLQAINIYTRIDKKKIKSSSKEYVRRTCFKINIELETFGNIFNLEAFLINIFVEEFRPKRKIFGESQIHRFFKTLSKISQKRNFRQNSFDLGQLGSDLCEEITHFVELWSTSCLNQNVLKTQGKGY